MAVAAYDKLATDPVLIDVSERLLLADAFVIASAPTERQVRAIAENVGECIGAKSRWIGELGDGILWHVAYPFLG